MNIKTKLRNEKPKNYSGDLLSGKQIKRLKEKHYYVIPKGMDGNAPKEFIGAYFYSKQNNFYKLNKDSWPKYIAKTAEKWYPIESVTEYIINKLGEEMGLKINESELVMCNNQIRFLSKYFLHKNEILLHGAEICGDYLNDRDFAHNIAKNKKDARELFTFEFICESLDKVFKSHSKRLKEDLVRMLVFDCIIGNNDRHFYNWGLIVNAKKKIKKPYFAPIYDTARGLFWNNSNQQTKEFYEKWETNGSSMIKGYANRSKPRISVENKKNANHFDLIEYIILERDAYKNIVRSLCTEKMERKIIKSFDSIYSQYFIKERRIIIKELLRYRFNKTKNLVL